MVGDVVEVECGPMVAGGDSLVRRKGERTVFVAGGLPGERVRAEVTNERKDLVSARVVEVLSAAPARVKEVVQLPVSAGGCEWQHIEPSAQHDFKVGIVTDSLNRIAKMTGAPVRLGGAVPSTGYRTTMRFGVVNGRAAMRIHGSNELVALERCGVAHQSLQDLIVEGRFDGCTEVTLRVSDTTGERLAWVKGDIEKVSVADDVVVTGDGRHVAITEEVGGRHWQISAPSFFQSGRAAAALLAAEVDSAVPKDAGWVVDAYAGVGLLGGIVAEERDAQLTAVEQSKSAVRDAQGNLADLAAEVIEAEVATVSLSGQTSPDAVIADPSRTGLGRSATRTLAGLGARTFVLVSCDPASLARDVVLLADHGYSLDDVAVLDLFPHTAHVETVSTFNKS